MASPKRSRTLLAAATAALVVFPGTAFAQTSFTPGDDPCLGDPPEAPYADREEVREPHLEAVDCTFDNGIFIGGTAVTGEREFHPAQSVTRAQMASVLVRALEHAGYTLPADAEDAFEDDSTSVHEDNINTLAAAGIVSGKTETQYDPKAAISRAEMATLLVQSAEMAYGAELEPQSGNPFRDVSSGSSHRDNIIVASEILGLAVGTGGDTYEPQAEVRRDWMATFVSRLVDMTLIDAEEPASDPASGPTVGATDDEREI
jgi:hypothetical protein